MHARSFRRFALTVAGLSLLVLAHAAPASADPAWGCRASAGYQLEAGEERVEPFAAGTGDRCTDDEARATGDRSAGPLSQRNPYARTSIEPDTGEPAAQSALAEARVESTTLASSDGGFLLTAREISAEARASCIGGVPTFEGSSDVSDVTVNGVPVDLAGPLEQIGTGLNGSPLGGLIRITFDESEESPDGLVRRAVHVVITNSAGEVVYEAVAGEAKVSRREAVCDTQGTSSLQCPAGSIRGGDGSCLPAAPVGDADQPIGGAYVALDQVPGALKSICRGRRFGPLLVAIMGTNGRDDVTGTNKSDRIFVLRGRDAVSGGRGNDCIEGGPHRNRLDGSTGGDYLLGGSSKDALMGGANADRLFGRAGRDRADGGLGNDRLFGGRGRDHLAGGPGHDRLNGGPGPDFIDAGTGRDRVNAGPGNDVINAANEGPPTRLRCGPGRDTVRINAAELRFLRGCERVFVTRRR